MLRSDTAHFAIQKSIQNNSFFIEAFGNSGWVSFNLDFIYQFHYTFRIGGAIFPGGTKIEPSAVNQFPVDGGIIAMVNYLLFKKSLNVPYFNIPFNVEIGAGVLTDICSNYRGAIIQNNDSRFKPTIFAGLRFQPFLQNHILRLGYTPFFDQHEIHHFAGVSYGYCIDPF